MGTGTAASSGKTVKVNYTGWLTNGKKFDSSLDRGTPFSFKLGAGQVIKGWDAKAWLGMKVAEVSGNCVMPPDLGYGSQGAAGVIPPNATLVLTWNCST